MKQLYHHEWSPWRTESGRRVIAPESEWRKPLEWDRQSEADVLGYLRQIEISTCEGGITPPPAPRTPRVLVTEDLFESGHSLPDMVFSSIIDHCPHLHFLLPTRHPQNVLGMWPRFEPMNRSSLSISYQPADFRCADGSAGWTRPNVTLLLQASFQRELDAGVPHLLRCADLCRVGLLLDPREELDLRRVHSDVCEIDCLTGDHGVNRPLAGRSGGRVRWVIVRGGSEPLHPDWVRSIRDQCSAAGVPFWFDCWEASGRKLDGREHLEVPE